MLKLKLVRGDNQEGVYLNFPTTPGEISEAYAMLDAVSRYAGEVRIADVKSTVYCKSVVHRNEFQGNDCRSNRTKEGDADETTGVL